MFYLNNKTTLYNAFNLRLKAINKGNIKIRLNKNTFKANQNIKKNKRVIYYNFKIFVVNRRK
jgi:hypothetical protein